MIMRKATARLSGSSRRMLAEEMIRSLELCSQLEILYRTEMLRRTGMKMSKMEEKSILDKWNNLRNDILSSRRVTPDQYDAFINLHADLTQRTSSVGTDGLKLSDQDTQVAHKIKKLEEKNHQHMMRASKISQDMYNKSPEKWNPYKGDLVQEKDPDPVLTTSEIELDKTGIQWLQENYPATKRGDSKDLRSKVHEPSRFEESREAGAHHLLRTDEMAPHFSRNNIAYIGTHRKRPIEQGVRVNQDLQSCMINAIEYIQKFYTVLDPERDPNYQNLSSEEKVIKMRRNKLLQLKNTIQMGFDSDSAALSAYNRLINIYNDVSRMNEHMVWPDSSMIQFSVLKNWIQNAENLAKEIQQRMANRYKEITGHEQYIPESKSIEEHVQLNEERGSPNKKHKILKKIKRVLGRKQKEENRSTRSGALETSFLGNQDHFDESSLYRFNNPVRNLSTLDRSTSDVRYPPITRSLSNGARTPAGPNHEEYDLTKSHSANDIAMGQWRSTLRPKLSLDISQEIGDDHDSQSLRSSRSSDAGYDSQSLRSSRSDIADVSSFKSFSSKPRQSVKSHKQENSKIDTWKSRIQRKEADRVANHSIDL